MEPEKKCSILISIKQLEHFCGLGALILMKNRIKIIIIDDDELVCSGIKASLLALPEVDIVGVFHQAEKALAWLNEHTGNIAIVDYYMPGLHGAKLLERLKTDFPKMKLITVTSEHNPYLLRQALNADVDSILVKGASNLLQDAVRAVMKGKTILQPELGIPIYRAERAVQATNTLTETQRFCFKQIALETPIEEIARHQKTTPSTIKDRLLQCRKKLGVKKTEDLKKLYHEFYPTEKDSLSVEQTVDTSSKTEEHHEHGDINQTSEKKIIDYESLLSQLNGDSTIIEELLTISIKDMEKSYDAMVSAYAIKDWKKIEELNHYILGTASTLRTERLVDACRQLTESIQAENTQQMRQCFENMIQEMKSFITYIKNSKPPKSQL